MTLEQSIQHYAIATPDKVAVVCGSDSVTYSKLWLSIEQRSSELRAKGLEPNRPYVFRATQDADFLITYCAIHYLGAIAVPLEAQLPDECMATITAQVESCAFDDDIADILYTTGTTGKSKGVMLSQRALESCAENFITSHEYSSELQFIISGPLNHIASLFKIHPTLTVGGAVCILDGLKDINAFFDVFDQPFSRFATFMVPASLRLIMQFAYDRLCAVADKMAFIETGAAPITRHDMEQLSRALPGVSLYNTLGGTEIGAVCTYNFNDGKFMEGCVGHPMKNSTIEVTLQGNIVVSGPTIMSGYVADEQTTNNVLRDGKIYGSDLGFFDAEGLLHLKERQGDVINVGGYKVTPSEVEGAIASHPSVRDSICVADTHPVIGTVLKLLVVLADGAQLDKRSLALHIKSKLEPYKVPTYYQAVESIRRTYNGKIDRKFYKENHK